MNSESIKTMAAEAIDKFARTHSSTCVLSIENGAVIATPLSDVTGKHDRDLVFNTLAQNHGLTAASWNTLGRKLYKLYSMETSCQTHQEHST